MLDGLCIRVLARKHDRLRVHSGLAVSDRDKFPRSYVSIGPDGISMESLVKGGEFKTPYCNE